MQTLKTIRITQQMMSLIREQGQTVGFVPTMGALHGGHVSLIEAARQECDVVVVSIFVNPTQFGEAEDFQKYPRDFEQDKLMLEKAEVDYLFYPEASEMYPDGEMIEFKLPDDLVSWGCAKSRPGHFEGVAQVCTKLFNIIKPSKVYFGQKDYQQTLVIERLLKDLNYDIELRVMPTVREADGLAMSSRNKRLSREGREKAKLIFKALQARDKSVLEGIVEYWEDHDGVLLTAVRIDGTRLIDNIVL